MPTTSNFGWTTPADTDLVKDGAAAIRTLGNGIDTSFVDLKGGTTNQVLAKNSNSDLDFKWVADASGIPATIFDAKGDIIAATAADTADRLAVGANGTVLTADSSTATGLKWATPSAGANWSIVNSSGTSLTGAQTITISGISSADKLMIIVVNASSASASSYIGIQMNSDTGNNYYNYGALFSAESTYSNTYVTRQALQAEPYIYFARLSDNAASTATGSITFQGCNSSGIKTFMNVGGAATGGGNSAQFYLTQGYYNSASTISSVSVYSSVGNFDGGTVYVYKSA